MIKFFRHIRQRLLSEKKFSRYLIYAIGEIVLVVLGILIALQINNWNEDRKARVQEKEILNEVRDNLKADTSLINERILRQRRDAIKISRLIHHLEANLEYNDSLNNYFFTPVLMEGFQVTRSGYETLKSIGLEKLQSQEIKNLITNYYDVLCQNILDVVEQKNLDNTRSMSIFNKNNFKRVISSIDSSSTTQVSSFKFSGYKPVNYNSLINSEFYINYLYERRGYKLGTYNKMQSEIKEAASKLLILIED